MLGFWKVFSMVAIHHIQTMMKRDLDMSRFGGDSFSHEREPLDAFEPCMLVGGTFQAWREVFRCILLLCKHIWLCHWFGISHIFYTHFTSTEFLFQFFPLILGSVHTNGNAKVENASDQNEILSLLAFFYHSFWKHIWTKMLTAKVAKIKLVSLQNSLKLNII